MLRFYFSIMLAMFIKRLWHKTRQFNASAFQEYTADPYRHRMCVFHQPSTPPPTPTHTTITAPKRITVFIDVFAEAIRGTHTGYFVSTCL